MYMHYRILYTYMINQQTHIIYTVTKILLLFTNIFQSLFCTSSDSIIIRIQTMWK